MIHKRHERKSAQAGGMRSNPDSAASTREAAAMHSSNAMAIEGIKHGWGDFPQKMRGVPTAAAKMRKASVKQHVAAMATKKAPVPWSE